MIRETHVLDNQDCTWGIGSRKMSQWLLRVNDYLQVEKLYLPPIQVLGSLGSLNNRVQSGSLEGIDGVVSSTILTILLIHHQKSDNIFGDVNLIT